MSDIFYLAFLIVGFFVVIPFLVLKLRKSQRYVVPKRKLVKKPVEKKKEPIKERPIATFKRFDKYEQDYLPGWTQEEKKLYTLIKSVLEGQKVQCEITQQEWDWYESIRYEVAKRRFERKNPDQRVIKKRANGVRSNNIQFEVNKV